jgi:hypothetical protein
MSADMSNFPESSGLRSSPRLRVFVITFAAVYAITYYIVLRKNWPLFSYGPAVDEWTLFNHSASDGPTMYWYGWMATSAITAAVLGLIAALLPEGFARKMWSCPAWVAPLLMVAAIIYLLSGYFTH